MLADHAQQPFAMLKYGLHRAGVDIGKVRLIDAGGPGAMEKAFRDDKSSRANKVTAEKVGKLVAERSISKQVSQVVFDRGGYIYHGKVAALADAARSGGLKF